MSPAHRERVKPVRRLSNGKAGYVSIESLGRRIYPAGQIHLAAGGDIIATPPGNNAALLAHTGRITGVGLWHADPDAPMTPPPMA
ncbi:hypothetical protein ACVNHC_18900 [Pannonibacter sp. Q-1]